MNKTEITQMKKNTALNRICYLYSKNFERPGSRYLGEESLAEYRDSQTGVILEKLADELKDKEN